jgi:mRNA interferase RelE/StbE
VTKDKPDKTPPKARVFEIRLSRSAAKALEKLEARLQDRIIAALNTLANDPTTAPGVVALSSRDAYRIRIGDYRVIYELDAEILVVLVLRIAHRREAYR